MSTALREHGSEAKTWPLQAVAMAPTVRFTRSPLYPLTRSPFTASALYFAATGVL